MDIETVIKEIVAAIQTDANVKAVFGEPMTLDSHKVIPVAQVLVSLGGGVGMGGGQGPSRAGTGEAEKREPGGGHGSGGAGGLAVRVSPLGFIHELEGRVAFTPIEHTPEGLISKLEARLLGTRS